MKKLLLLLLLNSTAYAQDTIVKAEPFDIRGSKIYVKDSTGKWVGIREKAPKFDKMQAEKDIRGYIKHQYYNEWCDCYIYPKAVIIKRNKKKKN